MIPDKIYIPTEYTDNDITPVGVTLQQVFPNDICYVRKDALLEWAKVMHGIYLKRYEGSTCTCGEHWGQMVAFQRIIDKLNQM